MFILSRKIQAVFSGLDVYKVLLSDSQQQEKADF